MTAQMAAALQTYLTRRVAMVVIALLSAVLLLMLWAAGMAGSKAPLFAGNLIGLPIMGAVFFLVQQAKWQFVHPRARLMPHYAAPHLGVNAALLAISVGLYPIVASQMTGLPAFGIAAFSALFAALLAWGMQAIRQVWMLAAMAVFFSLMIPRFSGFWLGADASLAPLRLAALAAGWGGLAMWLYRLTEMTEEDEDYLIPVQSQFGQSSRMEKSEARRLAARMVSRAKLQSWFADSWLKQLAHFSARTDADRQWLLRFGMAPSPPVVRAVFFMVMMGSIVAVQAAMLGSMKNTHQMIVVQLMIFSMVGPMFLTQFLAQRLGRLGQELLLPLSRESLVAGLLRSVTVEIVWILAAASLMIVVAAVVLTPEMLTPAKVTAALLAILSVQPLLVGASFGMGLMKSGMKRIVVCLLYLYATMGVAAGVVALGLYVSLIYAALLSLGVALLGWWSIRTARRKWLKAELG